MNRGKNDKYWGEAKLHQQVVDKALRIAEVLYQGYSLVFIFNNTTMYSFYIKQELLTCYMNENSGKKQPYIHNN